MQEIKTEIEINAPVKKVWDLFIDFEKAPKWNPLIKAVTGKPKMDGRMFVLLKFKRLGFSPLWVKVNVFEPGQELTWTGNVPLPGVLVGRHSFRFESTENNRTRFLHSERFTGAALLIPFVKKMIDGPIKSSYENMNLVLKARAEEN